MLKKTLLVSIAALSLSACFDNTNDPSETITKEDDLIITNPIDSVMPIVKGEPFDESMLPVAKESLSILKANRYQSGQAWDYKPYIEESRADVFTQKDNNINQDYPNVNLTEVRISVIGEKCLADGYPSGMSETEVAAFKDQIMLRTHNASLIYNEQSYDIDMTSEQAVQNYIDMRVWYRYMYDSAENKNGLCSKVSQSIADLKENEKNVWVFLKDPDIIGVEMAQFAVSYEQRSKNLAFCSVFLSQDGVIDNPNDIKAFIIDAYAEKSAAITTSKVTFFDYAKKVDEPVMADVMELFTDNVAKLCLSHATSLKSIAINAKQINDPYMENNVVDEGEVSAEGLPAINVDEDDNNS